MCWLLSFDNLSFGVMYLARCDFAMYPPKEQHQKFVQNLRKHDFQNEFKMAEALATTHTRGRVLLREQWWPIGPKLIFNQMAAPVPEIMDSSLFYDNTTTITKLELSFQFQLSV
jgi:hypothetical protein